MNRGFQRGLLLLGLTLSLRLAGQSGYSLTVHIKDTPGAMIRFGYHLGSEQYVRDSINTDNNGKATFKGDEKLAPGVYMIVLPTNKFVEFLIDREQIFDIFFEAGNPVNTLRFSGSTENEHFAAYQNKWKEYQDEAIALNGRISEARKRGDDISELRHQLDQQEDKMKKFLSETAGENKGILLGAIARSLIPVPQPEFTITPGTANPDSVRRIKGYLYYKDHFFDNIDFSQSGLIRSPVLAAKLDQFFRQVVIQYPDSVIKETDKLLDKASTDKEMYQYVAVWLFNRYISSEIMGHDGVVVHLADRIYLSGNAPWVSEEYLAELRKKIDRLRPNLIGVKATELIMNSFSGNYVSLYDIDADFTILYFWEPDCGHCKEATPKLKEFYDRNRDKGIEVFAVCTRDDREKWQDYIITNNLNWINGWDPERLSRYDYYYNIESTPTVYILDRDKKIIAKRLSVDDIGPFIEEYRRFNSQGH